ncbi:MAG: nucleoside triphosphate pyrophosphohydrolase [Pseudomonadota bacterium]|nr:nucleoside triphosphate pyrophosphohydrolase [Pseudomonadota bacterium]
MNALLDIMAQLRRECPWDQAQTPSSLTRYAIEEAYEVEAAVRDGDPNAVCDELGDLLLQVVFQAQMYQEQGVFSFADVVAGLQAKLIRRHPHVFAQQHAADADAVAQAWDQIKQTEHNGQRRRLDQVKAGSGLMQAQDLQKQAAKVGFDWPDVAGAQAKLHEEITELEQAMAKEDGAAIMDELGDCLFALVNVARKLNVQSEMAILGTVHKFKTRFAYIEDALAKRGLTPEHSNLAEMDLLWEEAKAILRLSESSHE